MNKRRGILIVSLAAIAAAIGIHFFWTRGRHESAHKTAQPTSGSVQAVKRNAERVEPGRAIVTIKSADVPITGATVRFEHESGDVTLVPTGSDGVARADNLEPGEWQISAAADDFEPAAARAQQIAAGETIQLEITLAPGGRLLSGIVTDMTGGPIAGARVDAAKLVAAARPGDAVASTLTGPDGKYKLSVAQGAVLVAASEASYAPQSRFVDVGAQGATADFQLVPGGVIEGIVRDERSREPVPEAVVEAQRDTPAMLLGERALHRVTAGADGRFRIAGLRPGAYELGARAEQRSSLASTLVGLGVAEQISDVEIIVSRAPLIRGVVVDDTGAPAPDVDVRAFSRGDNAVAKSDAKGAFVLEGLPAGNYMVMARSDVFVSAGATRVELAGKDVDGVKVQVRRGIRVKGHVERRQACDVSMDMDERRMHAADAMPLMMGTHATDSNGEFEFGPLAVASYEFTARCASGEQGSTRVEVKPGIGEVVIAVKPGASIAGKVVDGAGKPVAAVTVSATPTGGTERTMIVNGMVTSGVQALTNAAGVFELRGLAASTYRLRVLDRGRPLPMKADSKVTLSAVEHKTGVVLAVERPDGVIRGVVTGPDGKPLADAWVSLHQDFRDMLGDAMDRDSGGSRMVMVEMTDDGSATGGFAPALTDATGKFELRNLPRVPWTVIAEAQGGKLRGRATKVVPDAQITVQALGVTELRGKVIPAGPLPSSFHVELEGPTNAERSFASRDGTFAFARVDPGEYVVNVTSSAGNGRATVKVAAGQATTVDVTLAANAIVIGTLVDRGGKPLGGLPLAIIPDTGDGRLRVEMTGPPPTSNPDGTFRLAAKAGPSILMVMAPPQPTSKRGLQLEAGKTLDLGTITVDAGPPPP